MPNHLRYISIELIILKKQLIPQVDYYKLLQETSIISRKSIAMVITAL